MAKKYKQPEIGKVYKEPQTLYVKGKNGIVKRVHPKDLRHYEAAGTITPKGMTSSRVFFIKVVPAEQRAQAQWKSWMEEIPEEPEGKQDVVYLVLHFKNEQSHKGHTPFFIEGIISKYVLRDDVDREIEKLEWFVTDFISNKDYGAIASDYRGNNWLRFGNEEVDDAPPDTGVSTASFEVFEYEFHSGENGLLRKKKYTMGAIR